MTTADTWDHDLFLTCPGCGHRIHQDDLCGCEPPDLGPLCETACCPTEHLEIA